MVDDLKKGYYLLFIDGGKRANEEGEAEGAIGVILQEPDCGPVLAKFGEKVGPVGSPQEAEYHALIRGLKLAAEKRLAYVAAFSDSARSPSTVSARGCSGSSPALPCSTSSAADSSTTDASSRPPRAGTGATPMTSLPN